MRYLRNENLAIETEDELAAMVSKSVEVSCVLSNDHDIRTIEFTHDDKRWLLSYHDVAKKLFPLECREMEQVLTWRLIDRPKIPFKEMHLALYAAQEC